MDTYTCHPAHTSKNLYENSFPQQTLVGTDITPPIRGARQQGADAAPKSASIPSPTWFCSQVAHVCPRARKLTDSLALALFELDDLHVRNIALDGLGLERCLQTPAHDLGTDVGVPKVRNACLTPLLHMHLELFIAGEDFSSCCGSCCATPLLFAHANPWS